MKKIFLLYSLMLCAFAGQAAVVTTSQQSAVGYQKPVPSISLSAIKQFITQDQIIDATEFENSGYVIAPAGEHLAAGIKEKIYARGITQHDDNYLVFEKSDSLIDPKTKKPLAYIALNVGQAKLEKPGDPATLSVTNMSREIAVGDRLLPKAAFNTNINFTPHYPQATIDGKIVAVIGDRLSAYQRAIIVINQGTDQGVTQGDILAIYRKGAAVKDPIKTEKQTMINLPDEKTGEIIVFRTYKQFSLALVYQQAELPHILDRVANL